MSSILLYSTRKTQKLDRIGAVNGDPFGFFNIYSVAKHQKIEGGPFGEKLASKKKFHTVEKKLERGTL